MEILYIAGGLFVIIALFVIITYNTLVNLRNLRTESWSDVDTELKRRYDLIPNLVNVVKGYASHEQQTLEEVTRLRAQAVSSIGSPNSQAKDENELIRGLRTLFSVAEKYPDLKASNNFLELQNELRNTEDRIQAARRFFNANVRDYNNKVQAFPSNIIASIFNFRQEEFFEIEDTGIRTAPKVSM